MNLLENEIRLTAKELEVARKIMQGYTTKEIGTQMGISIHTVFNHRRSIYRKTGCRNVAGMINFLRSDNSIMKEIAN